MSDENKDEKKKEPQGCLVITSMILSVILVLLLLICYLKVEPSTLLSLLPSGSAQHSQETPSQETEPEETEPESLKLVEEIATLLDELGSILKKENKKPVATEPAQESPKVTEPTAKPVPEKPKATGPVTEKQEAVESVAESEESYLVVIDAGHQTEANREKEPVGPGAEETKIKVSSGTQGVATGTPEYELNLQLATKLQAVLEQRGYQVKMVRTENDVDISNAQRAEFANELKADAFIRIHANGDENSETHGIMTVCQTEENPYNGSLYAQSKRLSQCVLNEVVEATDGKKMFVWETDTLSGTNWCQVPATLIEVGYMTNPEEDKLLSTEEYQQKLVEGMANGIDSYFAQ